MRKGVLVRPPIQDSVGTPITGGAAGIRQDSSVMAVLKTDPNELEGLTDEDRLFGPSLDAELEMAWAEADDDDDCID